MNKSYNGNLKLNQNLFFIRVEILIVNKVQYYSSSFGKIANGNYQQSANVNFYEEYPPVIIIIFFLLIFYCIHIYISTFLANAILPNAAPAFLSSIYGLGIIPPPGVHSVTVCSLPGKQERPPN